MLKKILLMALMIANGTAYGQSGAAVKQSGNITPTHIPGWVTNGVIGDGGTAADSPITSLGVTSNTTAGFCVSSGRSTTAGRQQLCMGAPLNAPGVISLQNYGTATPQPLKFVINGTPVLIPTGGAGFVQFTGSVINGHLPCWTGTTGLVVDCGVGTGAGTLNGVAYYSSTDRIGSTGAGTNGQFLLGQTSSPPLWASLSGDVTSVSAAGAVTLGKVNGIPFASSYAANGVLIGEGTNAFHSVSTLNVGQCLLSQGASDPVWASCASGSGSAGGSNTQIQFNNSTALGGSPNLTWISPALTIGVAGSTTGQLQLASSTATGTVTLQSPGVSGTYNFNFPTGAGSAGQPLVSGGGGTTPNSFGTLGIVGGGTNCSTASGTCLDNITAFSSTGYITRTGSGSYAFSLVIPPSGGGTGLANGTSGGILGFTGASTIASSGVLSQFGLVVGGGAGNTPSSVSNGTAGQMLIAQTSANPSWNSMGGDATLGSSGTVTIANGAVTLAKQANLGAYTLQGNFTGSGAAPQASTLGALTNKASPAAGDYLLIADNAASGQLKYALVSSVSSAGSVSSIDAKTGAFTTGNGIDTSTNLIELTAARRTLPTTQTFTSGTAATYTTAANALWLEVYACGGGAGGSGAAAGTSTVAGTAGNATTFNSIVANGGSAGGAGSTGFYGGGVGGTGGTGSATRRYPGHPGGNGSSSTAQVSGSGFGGASGLFGGGGAGIFSASSGGITAVANSGSGGGGASNTGGSNNNVGSGGGGGECFYLIINNPAATYTYTVGGTAAGGSTNSVGGNGAAGYIQVVEHYGT